MPLLERVRVEVYIPDLPADAYRNLLRSFEEEFTYAFGGCTIVSGLEGSYLSKTGTKVPDRNPFDPWQEIRSASLTRRSSDRCERSVRRSELPIAIMC